MRRLREIIKSLDGKQVQKYTLLHGRYEKDGVSYYIRNVYGGQVKYCTVEITFISSALFQGYALSPADVTAASSFILREFSAAAHIANNMMRQDEANVAKGCFVVYKCGSKVLPNSVVMVSDEKVTVSLEVKLPYNNSATQGSFLRMTDKQQKNASEHRKKGLSALTR